jgi:membrane-associated phospholipid phosphatase
MTNPTKRWLPLHKVLVAYCLFTIILSLIPGISLVNCWTFYIPKLILVAIVVSWDYWHKKASARALDYLNAILGVGFLAFLYNETGQLNHLFFQPIDPFLANLEEKLFGMQPSLWFSAKFPGIIMVELMNLGYLSYYFIVVGFVLLAMHRKPSEYNRLLFLISQSFIIYYLIFIFVPSWGPQFYFSTPYNMAPQGIFFQKIIALIQHTGEAATGAMPSSHVGMTLIVLILAYRHFNDFFLWILPFALLLFCSTVYIKAHYFVDTLAGFITAPIILLLSHKVWDFLDKPTK